MIYKKHRRLGEKDILKRFKLHLKMNIISYSLPHEAFVELRGKTAEVDGGKWNK